MRPHLLLTRHRDLRVGRNGRDLVRVGRWYTRALVTVPTVELMLMPGAHLRGIELRDAELLHVQRLFQKRRRTVKPLHHVIGSFFIFTHSASPSNSTSNQNLQPHTTTTTIIITIEVTEIDRVAKLSSSSSRFTDSLPWQCSSGI